MATLHFREDWGLALAGASEITTQERCDSIADFLRPHLLNGGVARGGFRLGKGLVREKKFKGGALPC